MFISLFFNHMLYFFKSRSTVFKFDLIHTHLIFQTNVVSCWLKNTFDLRKIFKLWTNKEYFQDYVGAVKVLVEEVKTCCFMFINFLIFSKLKFWSTKLLGFYWSRISIELNSKLFFHCFRIELIFWISKTMKKRSKFSKLWTWSHNSSFTYLSSLFFINIIRKTSHE